MTVVTIPREEWEDENQKILHSNVLHRAYSIDDRNNACAVCGLIFDKETKQHISRYAVDVAAQEKISLLLADSWIGAGRYLRRRRGVCTPLTLLEEEVANHGIFC
jgi:hypothetical protein